MAHTTSLCLRFRHVYRVIRLKISLLILLNNNFVTFCLLCWFTIEPIIRRT
ncbi:Uncharacterised protein [Vibrio cholerae]|nr:Uncharacterised protein [Vibrio cholerae]